LLPCDLVLCGRQTTGLGSGAVGATIAEFLDVPMVAAITQLQVLPDGETALVERMLEHGGREVVRCSLPALLTVDAAINNLRYVSVRNRARVRDVRVSRWDSTHLGIPVDEVGARASRVKILSFSPPRPKRIFTPDSSLSAAERLRLVISGGVVAEEKGEFLQGAPARIAEDVVGFLREEKIIE
jgi:electron transfer flavoprotein beta subunit